MREYGEANAEYIKSWQNPHPQHWYDVAIGSSQAHITLTVNSIQKRAAVDLYINDNKELYAKLDAKREEIEAKLALKLDWQELPEKKASRIIASRPGDFSDETQSQELVEWMVATADNFARIFPHYL